MNRDRMCKLAMTALHSAIRDDWPAAAKAVQALNDLGDGSLMAAILAWCDTCLASQGVAMDAVRPVQVRWQQDGEGPLQSADEVSPVVRWAGQLINSRAADDELLFRALVEAIPEGAELGKYVGTLLQCIAVTLRIAGGQS
jgi:hypothetical protein